MPGVADDVSRRVLDTFVTLADTLASDYDVGDFLHFLVEQCVAALGMAVGGVLLEDSGGGLRLAAATSTSMQVLERWQMAHGEGPCLDAYRRREQLLVEDLADAHDRWPAFAPKAVGAGFRSAVAFPLRRRDDCIGVLNIYGRVPGAVEDDGRRLAGAFADVAAIGILQERSIASADRRAQQLQDALSSRVVIEQAKGALAERSGVDADTAFQAIRQHARSRRRRIHEVAREVIDGLDPLA